MTIEQVKAMVKILWERYIPMPDVNDQKKGGNREWMI